MYIVLYNVVSAETISGDLETVFTRQFEVNHEYFQSDAHYDQSHEISRKA